VVDYVGYWKDRTGIAARQILQWMGMYQATFAKWKRSYGQEYQHNGWIPRDHWLEPWERERIIQFHYEHPLEGYRRLTYMMIDRDVVAVSPSTVYRVLSAADLLNRRTSRTKTKGTGFHQPSRPHRHWHVDVAHLNICGTFYFMTTVIDGFSRAVVHWEIREKMEELDIEIILQRAHEKHPDEKPRVITDNGPQFISHDFKAYIRLRGMTHVRTSPYYPQSNGKIERYHRTIKHECIRPKTPLSLEDARRVVTDFVKAYNNVRLHSAIGYITPADKMAGRAEQIQQGREQKLADAKQHRAEAKKNAKQQDGSYTTSARPEDKAMLGSNLSAESEPETESEELTAS
jgi:putative transposase